MSIFYKFPKSTEFGRVIPKSKIYEHASAGNKIREIFVREVDKIVWAYKLSPETINIPPGENVKELQVFEILLKTQEISEDILLTIDKAIPSQILFFIKHNGKCHYTAAYKRPNDSDKNKWVISSYFSSGKFPEITEENPKTLPVVLNMDLLYEYFIKELIPLKAAKIESLRDFVERADKLKKLKNEIFKLESKIKKEKQFNHRVELNRELNQLRYTEQELLVDE